MRKYIVLITVVLIAILIVIKFLTKPKEKPIVPQPLKQEIPFGREIPREANKEVDRETKNPPSQDALLPLLSTTYLQNSLNTTLTPTYIQVTGCNKTPKNIIEDYGNIWGPGTKKSKKMSYTFSQEETNNIITLLTDYITCVAIAKKDVAYCNTLPEEMRKMCVESYYTYKMKEYLIGKDTNINNCLGYYKIEEETGRQKGEVLKALGVNDYFTLCQKMKLGIDKLCNNKSLSECNDNKKSDLLEAAKRYRETGSFDCNIFRNPKTQEQCKISNIGETACAELLNKLTLTYCNYYQKLMEKIKREEEKKKEEEIIKRAKELIQKQKKTLSGGEDEE
ncbi:MAG: hypothetical protein K6357_07775 [Elusimicrobiota bacterium]